MNGNLDSGISKEKWGDIIKQASRQASVSVSQGTSLYPTSHSGNTRSNIDTGKPLLVQEGQIQVGDFKISVQKLGELLRVLADEHPEIMC